MREMKDSGIEWIGEIPRDWTTKPLKSILAERKETNNPVKSDYILSLTNDRGVIPYSEKGDVGNKSKEDLSAYKLAYPNDIVLNSMNVVIGSVGLSKYYGCVSPVYYMLYPRFIDDCDIKFYNYIFQTEVFQKNLKGYGNGIMEIRMRIPMSKLNTVQLPFLPLQTQKRIADYLDKQCAEIDAVIEKTKATIEEYKKLKQSIITEAVTKGLNPDASMKDSGIEWIGNIPLYWGTAKLKYLIYLRARLGWKGLKAEEYVEEGYPLLSAFNIINDKLIFSNLNFINQERYDESPEIKLQKNDILLVKDGAGIGKCAIVENLEMESTTNGSLAVITPFDNLNSKYLYYYFLSTVFQQFIDRIKGGMGVPHLFQGDLKEVTIPYPKLEEQNLIVSYLDEKCSAIDTIIEKKQTIISELESYKKSLIYECVTGKKEV